MKSIIRFSLKNTVALLLLTFLVIGGGIYSVKMINIEKYPNVDIPYMTVIVPYPGASPEQSITDIGEPLERELMKLDGVENIYTDGVANAAYSTIEFDMSVDMKEVESVVRTAAEKVILPEGAKDIEVRQEGIEPDPSIYTLGVYGGTQEETEKLVKNKMIPLLEGIEGVNKVEADGITDKKVFIRVIPEKLSEKGLTMDDVKNAILANSLSIPTGDVTVSGQVLPVRVSKELTSVEDIQNITLFAAGAPNAEGKPTVANISLKEVAEVAYGPVNSMNFTRINGKEGLRVRITAETGANIVGIVENVKKELKDLSVPKNIDIETLSDQSKEIKESVYAMLREAMLGAGMAVLVTLLFLRNIRSTLIAVISIPLSILASLTFLNMLGYTLNIMTLAGIAVAVGRVVDDSIVVIENVFRRVRASKERNEELVETSTREVASAITSSTITTVAVFLPMAFVPGIVGKMFAPLAWTIVISLLFSLLVAITIVPLLSKMFLLKITEKEHKEGFLQKGYRYVLNKVLNHRLVTLAVAIILLASSVAFIAPKLGTTFLPQEKVVNYDINVTMEKGTAPKTTSDVAADIEKSLLEKKEIKKISTSVNGEYESALISFEVKDSIEDVNGFIEDLREELKGYKKANEVSLTGVGGMGGGESQFVLVVKGSDLKDIQTASNQISESLKDIKGMADVRTSMEGDEPEIELDMDEEKMKENGLMPALVGKGLREVIVGDTISTMNIQNEKKDIALTVKMDQLNSLDDVGELTIKNAFGAPMKIKDIGTLKKVENRMAISHLNGNEYVMVVGQITDANTGEVTKNADEAIASLKLPKGVSYYKEGASAAMEEGFVNMALAIGVSIFFVYITMVIAFGEGKAPFVILFAIPFSIIGALLGLYAVGEPIGMPAMIGLLMLNGIVVTNAIVLIDRVKQNERKGIFGREAIIEAGAVRLRPILMTAVATVGALIPMAVSSHAGIVSSSLAVVVIGGLATSTMLTLIIVPVLYSLFHPQKKQKKIVEESLPKAV
ncbi:efflux RND transporter permease subunit [Peribacillus alkalitolerans]|uniref:efflux RND transporter permease subunit n=1 Tax=Peribacillus alkalitolerans TaxID=1550385 RepID=UPI0013D5C548|nr:efflux RND transporter permease subunit [Peribacillus alkalitolerans]